MLKVWPTSSADLVLLRVVTNLWHRFLHACQKIERSIGWGRVALTTVFLFHLGWAYTSFHNGQLWLSFFHEPDLYPFRSEQILNLQALLLSAGLFTVAGATAFVVSLLQYRRMKSGIWLRLSICVHLLALGSALISLVTVEQYWVAGYSMMGGRFWLTALATIGSLLAGLHHHRMFGQKDSAGWAIIHNVFLALLFALFFYRTIGNTVYVIQ